MDGTAIWTFDSPFIASGVVLPQLTMNGNAVLGVPFVTPPFAMDCGTGVPALAGQPWAVTGPSGFLDFAPRTLLIGQVGLIS